MTHPRNYLLRMIAFLIAVFALTGLLSPVLMEAFLNNPLLNSFILLVLLLGILWNLGQVTRLTPEVAWVEAFQNARHRLMGQTADSEPTPRLLAPMANMLAARSEGMEGRGRFTLSAGAMRSLLDGISSRLDESRELSRYMTGLLIFLGLLGTFWGLLKTVSAVSDVIGSMTVGSGDVNLLFEQLKSGLIKPIAGMGTAFSASMFGLAGALVLGFLDLTAGQAQNRFYNELEEWLAGLTRLSSGVLAEGEGSVPVYVQALLEQTAENMEQLQRVLTRGEERGMQMGQALTHLAERMGSLSDTLRTNQQLMLRIAESQAALGPALTRFADSRAEPYPGAGGDEIAQAHLRNIELVLQRLLAETEQGRAQATTDLRSDLRLLTRTVAGLSVANQGPGQGGGQGGGHGANLVTGPR